MTYQELQAELQTIKSGEAFQFDLSWINSRLTEQLDDFVKIVDNIINLMNSKYDLVDADTISLTGEIHVKGSLTYFEIRLAFFNTPDLDYMITVEPNGKWEDEVDGSIRTILRALPVDFKETMFIHSSMDLEKATIVFDENKIYELGITKGVGIITHIKSDLLKKINLPNTLFHITRTPEGIYKVIKELNFESSIASVFKILVNKIQFIDRQSIEVSGVLTLPFTSTLVPSSFIVNKDLYQAKIKINRSIKLNLPYFLAGDGIYLGNVELDIQGSFIQPEYNYGLFADFAIGQEVKPRSVSASRNILNDGELRIIYNSTSQATLIPILIEAFAKEITLSKIVQLFAGKIIKIPEFLNQIAKFYSTYFYYCEPSQSRVLLNGVEAKKGIALSSGVNILGLDAYCDFSAIEQQTKGNIIIEPINIANLIKIEGDGIGSPPNYKGPVIKKGGVQLYFESKGPIYFRTDVSVNLFDIYKFKTGATIQEEGLQFYYDLDLSFVKVQIDCLLNSINNFKLESKFDAQLLSLKADLGVLGKLSLNLATKCEIFFTIKSQTSDEKAFLMIGFSFNGSSQKINLSFNIKDIRSLEEVIRRAIIDLIILLLKSGEEWLKAILNGIIKIADNALQEAKRIAENLTTAFGQSLEDSAKLLKNAGYSLIRTTEIFRDGYGKSAKEIASLLQNAKYTTEQIAHALLSVMKVAPIEAYKILKKLDEPIEEIGKALKGVSTEIVDVLKELELDNQDAAKLLKGLGKTVDEQAQILKNVLGVGEDGANAVLRGAGNVTNEVIGAIGRVFGGGGGGNSGPRMRIGGQCIGFGC
ncbi:hypothetical protein ADIARSV_0551 [Arcticibacter svalbardensis MN12-7]|uniref:Uncharacterized protein n=1 Tax=Arcticibacter svalbardensis MN12-7 TaxID=1150600 RepID=R9GX32_9SPHI|nr:hypothetical protein [Arcticibacter svalbardensis]EOR96316.1 hypothetical protein ADIARSV_0551 [Arcticibacter svalbardensis MN12-7]